MEKYYKVNYINEILNKLAKETVELPRRATWKHKTYTPGGIHDTYGCTNCGFTTGWTTDFCGGCGAYMRGELK